MSSKTKRPHGLLQAQVQHNLQGTLALHRQHLQQASQGGAAGGARPPQLPGVGLPALGAGYPTTPEASSGSAAAAGPSRVRTPQRRASSSSSSRVAGGATGSSVASGSPSNSRSRRHARAASSEVKASPGARRSPSSTASNADRERLSSLDAQASAEGDDDEEDDELLRQLEELQELSSRLGISTEEGGSSGSGALETRPTTGGTSASASTTARGGSSAGCTVSEDEPGSEAWTEGGPYGAEESDLLVGDWHGAICASYELQNLRLPHGCRVEKSPGSSGQLFFTVDVGEGPFTPATLSFWVKVFDDFPKPGSCSVRCMQRIFHPSVDPSTGRIEIPDEVFEASDKALSSVLGHVRQLILTPGDSPAANADAALLLQTDPDEFRRTVRFTLNGGQHRGQSYDKVLQLGKPAAASSKASADSQQASMAEAVRLKVMKLEVMKDQFKSQTSEMQRRNSLQIASLE